MNKTLPSSESLIGRTLPLKKETTTTKPKCSHATRERYASAFLTYMRRAALPSAGIEGSSVMWLFEIGHAFCGCPFSERSTIWGLY